MIQASYASHQYPTMTVLNQEQIHEIIQAAFLVLERTGAKITHEPMLKKLRAAGAEVKNDRVYVPRWLAQSCLDMAPKGMVIYDRLGRPAMHLSGRKSHYGTSTASPQNRDALTGEIHETRLNDIAQGAKVAYALPHIDFVMPFGSAQDCPTKVAEAHEYLAVLENTIKPVVVIGYTPFGLKTVLDMAALVTGGTDELKRKPPIIPYPEPISPLYWPDEIVEKIIICAQAGVPQVTTGANLLSLTAPVTLAGGLVQSTAESFFSNVMAQLTAKGAPVFLAAIIDGVNPRNSLVSMAGPEYQLAMAAQTEVARFLGLPTWGVTGATDAKTIDAQAGAEAGIGTLMNALAGINLVHDVGYIDSGLQCSAAMLVLGDEIISMVKNIMQGIVVNADTLATEVIDRVGPGGSFMTQKHTVTHMRQALWSARLFSKDGRESWTAAGSKTCEQAADVRVREILTTHQPQPLEPKLVEELKKMIASAEKQN